MAEPIRYINATPSLGPVVRELVGEKEKRQQAESAERAAKQRVEVVEKALPETGWAMPRVKVKKERKYLRARSAGGYTKRPRSIVTAWARISTCTCPNSARPTGRRWRRKSNRPGSKAAAAAKTNVQQELQRLQAQETGYLALQTEHQVLKETNKTLVTERNAWKKKYDEMVAHVKPYLEALKQLPERLVSKFNGFLSSLAEHVNTKDREKGQDVERE